MQVGASMTLSNTVRRRLKTASLAVLFGTLTVSLAMASGKDTKSKEGAKTVDSGTFGVLMNGKRVATETFSIQQDSTGSLIKSEFKTDAGVEPAAQSSELSLTPNGDLRSYEWKESGPGQSEAKVEPGQDFLTEHYRKSPQDKMLEQPFLLPASTSILDDYFLIQREVLAWKYLATSCKQQGGQVQCPMKQNTQMGTLNAHTRASSPVSVQFAGREKVQIHGVDRELIRLDMKSDVGDWSLWLDDQLKLQRIVDPASNTEVVRD